MPRNSYQPAAGVLALDWRHGEAPRATLPMLVEVWSSTIEAGLTVEKTPIFISARFEIRFYDGSQWQTITRSGEITPSDDATVRRWAWLGNTREWRKSITLDGWHHE